MPLGGVGGAEKFVHSLCRYHDRSRFDISVCILFPFTGYAVADEIAASGLEIIKLNMSNGFDLLKASRLISLIRRKNADIVNIHGQNPLGKLCSILGFAPVVIHTDHGTTAGSPVRRKGRVVYFNRLLTPYIDQFIAISKGMEKSLRSREKIPASKISLIYNGVDVTTISAVACNKEELKRSLGIPPHAPVLGTVGRLVPEKQYPLMFEALALLKKAHIAFSVLIAGDGPQRQHRFQHGLQLRQAVLQRNRKRPQRPHHPIEQQRTEVLAGVIDKADDHRLLAEVIAEPDSLAALIAKF